MKCVCLFDTLKDTSVTVCDSHHPTFHLSQALFATPLHAYLLSKIELFSDLILGDILTHFLPQNSFLVASFFLEVMNANESEE